MVVTMTTTTVTTRLKIAGWDESPTREFDDGSKVTRAAVTLSDGPDGLSEGQAESVMYYRPDGTSTFVTVMRLTASLEGRSGSFVLAGDGSFDGTTASETVRIVPGSGTGDLVGISGTCTSVSTHDDYPHMPLELSYNLDPADD
jgi:hypothetical protein